MKITIGFLLIYLLVVQKTNGQFQTNNKDLGFVISNDFIKKGNRKYVCGSFNTTLNINNTNIKGSAYNYPFVAVFDDGIDTANIHLIVNPIDGYSEFKSFSIFDNYIYITGVFTNKILINGDTFYSENKWSGFILKLNDSLEIIWKKIQLSNGNLSSPELLNYDNLIISKSTLFRNDSLLIQVDALNKSNGYTSWRQTISKSEKEEFIGMFFSLDTLSIVHNGNNIIYNEHLLPLDGKVVKTITKSYTSGYFLDNFFNENLYWLTCNNNLGTKELALYSNDNNSSPQIILKSDYFGSCEIINVEDSLLTIIGFFQGKLFYDSINTLYDVDSNSFKIVFNMNNSKIIDFELLPINNIFKTYINDSILYFISNYLDGFSSKRSVSSFKFYNGDTKLTLLKFPRQSTNNQSLSINFDVESEKIILYPNFNQGSLMKICCISKESVENIILTNTTGQTIAQSYNIENSIISIIPESDLLSGVYYIKILGNNSSVSIFKLIVSN